MWTCNCGIKNAGLLQESNAERICIGASHANLKHIEHYQITLNTPEFLMAYLAGKELGLSTNEDKFKEFFNHETILISSMTETQRIEHIEELEVIAFEAKARLTAAKSYDRDQKAKRFKTVGGDNTITVLNPDQTVSDAIAKVELRRKRMTKLDKIRASLVAQGIDQKDIDTMMSAMTKAAVKSVDKNNTAASTQAVQETNGNDSPKLENESSKTQAETEPYNPPAFLSNIKFG